MRQQQRLSSQGGERENEEEVAKVQEEEGQPTLVVRDGVKTVQLPGPSHPYGTIATLGCRLPLELVPRLEN